MEFIGVNPADGRFLKAYPLHGRADLDALLEQAALAQAAWAAIGPAERCTFLRATAGLLRARADKLAGLMAQEMGKPVDQGRAEAEKCAWVCEDVAERAPRVLADRPVATESSHSYVCFQPTGLVLAIMPWNFPLWQVVRAAAPALAAGNAILLKHAPTTQGCAEALCDLFIDAGLPAGLLTNLRLDLPQVAELIGDGRVAGVTLTGSTRAGRAVAAIAGHHLKKCVLELGGSDPAVVLADADLDLAARTMVASRMINNGQSCIAAKRFIALEQHREELEERVTRLMAEYAPGNPLEDGCRLGPMARADLRDELHAQVERSVAAGAIKLLGGQIPNRPGNWYPATVLTDVRPGMPAFDEELFGPVAVLCWAADETQALALAACSDFGLGASVFTQDADRGEGLARRHLIAGGVFVNAMVKSDPRLPFGGVRASGHGRELADFGLLEFVNIKTIWVA